MTIWHRLHTLYLRRAWMELAFVFLLFLLLFWCRRRWVCLLLDLLPLFRCLKGVLYGLEQAEQSIANS